MYLRNRNANLIREISTRRVVAPQRFGITACLSCLSYSETVLDLVSMFLRIVFSGREGNGIAQAATSMAYYWSSSWYMFCHVVRVCMYIYLYIYEYL